MELGILGFTQAGRSTVFSLLTETETGRAAKRRGLHAAPACVRDPRVDRLREMYQPKRSRYAEFELVLLPPIPAETGQGGPDWIEPARTMDAFIRVIRAFEAPEVFHPLGSVDPERDLRRIESECLLSDYTLVQTRLERIAAGRTRRKSEPQVEQEKNVLERCSQCLEAETPLRTLGLSEIEKKTIASLGLLTLKPVVTVLNTDLETAEAERRWNALVAEFEKRGETVLAVNAAVEAEIAELPDEDRAEFMREMGIDQPAAHRLSHAAFSALGLISFFTVGPDEVRAWPLRRGSTAPEAAGVIHSDLQRGFIRAEVIPYPDLVEAGSEKAARQAHRFSLKGKDYVVQDGDVIEIRFSV